MKKYTVELFDPKNKFYKFQFITESRDEAVTKAMDSAFEQMPDNQFSLAGIIETTIAKSNIGKSKL